MTRRPQLGEMRVNGGTSHRRTELASPNTRTRDGFKPVAGPGLGMTGFKKHTGLAIQCAMRTSWNIRWSSATYPDLSHIQPAAGECGGSFRHAACDTLATHASGPAWSVLQLFVRFFDCGIATLEPAPSGCFSRFSQDGRAMSSSYRHRPRIAKKG